MPREPQPWYRADRDAWYATVDRRRYHLADGWAGRTETWRALRKILKGRAKPAPPGRVSLGELVERFLARCRAELSTVSTAWYRGQLVAFAGFSPEMAAEDVRASRGHLDRVLADSDAGMPTKQCPDKYRVCPAWDRRLKQRRRETDSSISPKIQRHGPLPRRPDQAAPVAETIEQAPDATLGQRRCDQGPPFRIATLWRLVRDMRLTFKRKSLRAAEQDRPDVRRRRDG